MGCPRLYPAACPSAGWVDAEGFSGDGALCFRTAEHFTTACSNTSWAHDDQSRSPGCCFQSVFGLYARACHAVQGCKVSGCFRGCLQDGLGSPHGHAFGSMRRVCQTSAVSKCIPFSRTATHLYAYAPSNLLLRPVTTAPPPQTPAHCAQTCTPKVASLALTVLDLLFFKTAPQSQQDDAAKKPWQCPTCAADHRSFRLLSHILAYCRPLLFGFRVARRTEQLLTRWPEDSLHFGTKQRIPTKKTEHNTHRPHIGSQAPKTRPHQNIPMATHDSLQTTQVALGYAAWAQPTSDTGLRHARPWRRTLVCTRRGRCGPTS